MLAKFERYLLKAAGVGIPEVEYTYRDSSITGVDTRSHTAYPYRIKICRANLKQIESPDDLRPFFKKVNYQPITK